MILRKIQKCINKGEKNLKPFHILSLMLYFKAKCRCNKLHSTHDFLRVQSDESVDDTRRGIARKATSGYTSEYYGIERNI